MTDPTLTPDRLRELRLIVSGAERDEFGLPFVPNRSRLRWFAIHGYIKWGPRPPAIAERRIVVRRSVIRTYEVTDKARAAVSDAERSAA